jgi:hypothetical protein
MEYFIRLNARQCPKPGTPVELEFWGDYPGKKQPDGTYSDKDLYSWSISLVESSEMFIKEKQ